MQYRSDRNFIIYYIILYITDLIIVTVNNNSPIQDYVHPDDQTQPFEVTPGFKPFIVL